MECINCGTGYDGRFCPACGQRAIDGRYTMGGVAQALVQNTFQLDRGLLRTIVELTLRPVGVIRDYLRGRTAPYSNPFSFLVLLVGAATILSIGFGVAETALRQSSTALSGESAQAVQTMNAFFLRYFNVLMLAVVPFTAIGSRLAFRRSGLNFAEHLIANTYIYAQEMVLYILLIPAFVAWPAGYWTLTWFWMIVATGYYAWVWIGLAHQRPFGGTLRALGATVVGYLLYFLAAGLIGAGVALSQRAG